ncbi:hypothetical protein [Jannaschia sp. CCS1]|uniref:hypothetical protein n=1 Tax=Jannaschia sp. (strain CCS1) TaxID=290400 RepID=UPI000053C5AA|nr:hypothetical protein [Jannaschia sp. CCS1]ABD55914.1 hypothetical protein Jann_2997 [Jannaschia sp. CCS1]
MRSAMLLLCLLLLACGPSRQEFDGALSAEARTADYPSLVPLGPLLTAAEAPLVRTAASEGTSLEARAADLRRRAARLQAMAL